MLELALLLLLQDEAAAVRKALPLIQAGAAEAASKRNCFTCHHQALPVYALTSARRRGFAVDAAAVDAAVKHTAEALGRGREAYLKGEGQGGRAATAGYGLWTLDLGGVKPDATTAAVGEYLTRADPKTPYWTAQSLRPPTEGSRFTATAFAVLGLKVYAEGDAAKRRIDQAREWLASTRPADTEDLVFRVWGMHYAGGPLAEAVKELQWAQREDGGWGQLPSMGSDAYATGSALAVLAEVGKSEGEVYRRGVKWLLAAQKEDGSWHVATRSKPIQKHFESGFPHGKDQFISISATCWAVAALAATAKP